MLCEKLIHLHVPRTGGQKIRSVIRSQCRVLDTRTHAPYSQLLRRCSDLGIQPPWPPAVAVTRNPWDYYLSRYCKAREQIETQGPHPLASLSFAEHMMEIYSAWKEDRRPKGAVGRTFIRTLSQWDSWIVDVSGAEIFRFEDWDPLATRVADLLEIPENVRSGLFSERTNTSMHKRYPGYFNGRMRKWVAEMDRAYIEKHRYRFGGTK